MQMKFYQMCLINKEDFLIWIRLELILHEINFI